MLDLIEEWINKNLPHMGGDQKTMMAKYRLAFTGKKLNIMITGATGCGKSSTINAMFNMNVAKVGTGADPETMIITKYNLGDLIIWDSPGLGDGKEKDEQHRRKIIQKLNELAENKEIFSKKKEHLIDLVLVIIDGSTRDLGTSYELINDVIIPNLGKDPQKRLIIAMNQADVSMKGRFSWDYKNNKPTEKSRKFLEDKILSIKNRIKEATNLETFPMYYCAGYKEKGEAQKPYNLSKLLNYIIHYSPIEKRLFLADNVSKKKYVWEDDDNKKNYIEENKKTFLESLSYITKCITAGATTGAAIGSAVPIVGTSIGTAVGSIVGLIGGMFSG